MTECERIIEQGILPRSFFEEEVRCDFLVTKERKKIWAVQLDMLLKIDEICKKYGLSYHLLGGSLLGAVRHHGFIPWDDDMDIGLKRDDYERLLLLADQFKFPYFLQSIHTDPNCAFSYTRLCNVNTTEFSEVLAYQSMCHGIWIDILPLDNWIKEDIESFEEIRRLNIENGTYMRMTNPWLNEANRNRVKTWSGINPKEAYERINKLATQYNEIKTQYVMYAVATPISMSKKLREAELYSSVVQSEFETIHVPIPIGAEKILEIQYGDYMKLPPTEKRGIWHNDVIFDADIPYEKYLKTYKEKKNDLRSNFGGR